MHQNFCVKLIHTYTPVITLLGRSSLSVSFEAKHVTYPYCLTTGKLSELALGNPLRTTSSKAASYS